MQAAGAALLGADHDQVRQRAGGFGRAAARLRRRTLLVPVSIAMRIRGAPGPRSAHSITRRGRGPVGADELDARGRGTARSGAPPARACRSPAAGTCSNPTPAPEQRPELEPVGHDQDPLGRLAACASARCSSPRGAPASSPSARITTRGRGREMPLSCDPHEGSRDRRGEDPRAAQRARQRRARWPAGCLPPGVRAPSPRSHRAACSAPRHAGIAASASLIPTCRGGSSSSSSRRFEIPSSGPAAASPAPRRSAAAGSGSLVVGLARDRHVERGNPAATSSCKALYPAAETAASNAAKQRAIG